MPSAPTAATRAAASADRPARIRTRTPRTGDPGRARSAEQGIGGDGHAVGAQLRRRGERASTHPGRLGTGQGPQETGQATGRQAGAGDGAWAETQLGDAGIDLIQPALVNRAAFSELFAYGGDLTDMAADATITTGGNIEKAQENARSFAEAVYDRLK